MSYDCACEACDDWITKDTETYPYCASCAARHEKENGMPVDLLRIERLVKSADDQKDDILLSPSVILQLIAVVKASMKHLEEYEDVFDMAVPNKHQSKGAKEAQDELRAALLPFRK